MIRWMRRCGGIIWCSIARNLVKVAEALRAIRSVTTSPVATFIAAMIEMVPWRAYSTSRRASRPGGDLRVLARFPVDAGLLIDADQRRAGRRVEVQAAHGPGPGPEGRGVGAVEPAADLVRADPVLDRE